MLTAEAELGFILFYFYFFDNSEKKSSDFVLRALVSHTLGQKGIDFPFVFSINKYGIRWRRLAVPRIKWFEKRDVEDWVDILNCGGRLDLYSPCVNDCKGALL